MFGTGGVGHPHLTPLIGDIKGRVLDGVGVGRKPEGEERKRDRPGVGICIWTLVAYMHICNEGPYATNMYTLVYGVSLIWQQVCVYSVCFFLCIFDDDFVHKVCVRNYSLWAINILFIISKGDDLDNLNHQSYPYIQ